jgi:hypothetical protein
VQLSQAVAEGAEFLAVKATKQERPPPDNAAKRPAAVRSQVSRGFSARANHGASPHGDQSSLSCRELELIQIKNARLN